jgi:hypothetical protein
MAFRVPREARSAAPQKFAPREPAAPLHGAGRITMIILVARAAPVGA